MNPKVENLKGKLIVSCQALPDEPLHSSFIMGRMALAAKQGGASGIRANTPEDIKEIKTQVDLPVIGIIKRNYDDCEIYITPTIKEIDELMEAKPEIIALDATISSRPKGQKLDEFFHEIKEKYPDQLLMADCSTIEEALHADELGFDFIGTTMVGYTKQSKDLKIDENDFEIMELLKDRKAIVLLNKSDLTPVTDSESIRKHLDKKMIAISAKEQTGIEELEETIREMFFTGEVTFNDEVYITNIRHKTALQEARNSLNLVVQSILDGMPEDFYSIDLMNAYEELGSIVGEAVEDDLVNEIFSKFCMGK